MNIELIERELLSKGLATRADLRRRELTPEEWEAICRIPLLKDWHCIANSRMVDRVLNEIAQNKEAETDAKATAAQNRARALMQGAPPTEVEMAAADDSVDAFLERYPQYLRDDRNKMALFTELHRAGGSITDYDALVRAYEACIARGELIIKWRDREVTGYALKTHAELHKILAPAAVPDRLDNMSAAAFREMNNKIDREAGRTQRSLRAEHDAEAMFSAWLESNPGYAVFENQNREDVKRLIFEHLDSEDIPWSLSAVADAARYLQARGELFRDSDRTTGESGEFRYKGATLVVHKPAGNPLTDAAPPRQEVQIVDRVKRFTPAQIRSMTAEEYARNMQNPEFAAQVEELFR